MRAQVQQQQPLCYTTSLYSVYVAPSRRHLLIFSVPFHPMRKCAPLYFSVSPPGALHRAACFIRAPLKSWKFWRLHRRYVWWAILYWYDIAECTEGVVRYDRESFVRFQTPRRRPHEAQTLDDPIPSPGISLSHTCIGGLSDSQPTETRPWLRLSAPSLSVFTCGTRATEQGMIRQSNF